MIGRGRRGLAGAAGAAHPGAARPPAAAVGRRPRPPGSPAPRLRQQLAVGQPGPEGSAVKLAFARLNQELSGLELELLGEDGLRYDDWTMRRPDDRGLRRTRRGLPVPAGQGQLDRGRHLRDPAQHHRRAGARAAGRAAGRQGRRRGRTCPDDDDLRSAATPTSRTSCARPCAACSPTAARRPRCSPASRRDEPYDAGLWRRSPPTSAWPACRCPRSAAARAPRRARPRWCSRSSAGPSRRCRSSAARSLATRRCCSAADDARAAGRLAAGEATAALAAAARDHARRGPGRRRRRDDGTLTGTA